MRLRRSVLLPAICALTAFAFAGAWPLYGSWAKALAWHVQHGASFSSFGYRFTVPRDWYVDESDAFLGLTLRNARTVESISARLDNQGGVSRFKGWADLEKRMPGAVQQDKGLFICFEQDFAIDVPARPEVHLVRTIHLP